jgi:transcriptional regulator with XRE-family HTH domain
MKLSQLVAELQKLKGSGGWKRIAQISGVDYDTVARIARGSFPNPGVVTCERIEDALGLLALEQQGEAKPVEPAAPFRPEPATA